MIWIFLDGRGVPREWRAIICASQFWFYRRLVLVTTARVHNLVVDGLSPGASFEVASLKSVKGCRIDLPVPS